MKEKEEIKNIEESIVNIDKLKQIYEAQLELVDNPDNYVLEVKNYKIMCELLGEEEKTGNSKKAQTKEWKRYFDYIKEKQKYIIREIYDKPLPKNMYQNPLDVLNEYIICEKIIDHIENPKYKDKRYVCSMTQLAYDLGYVNDLFKKGYEHPQQMVEEIFGKKEITKGIEKRGQQLDRYEVGNKYRLQQLEEDVVYDFYSIVPRRYKDRINETLNRLQKEFIINVSIINFGTFIEPDLNNPIVEVHKDRYGDKKIDYKYNTIETFRELTDEEDNLVAKIRREIIDELGCSGEHDLYKYRKINKFQNRYREELLKLGISSVKKCYVLAFGAEYIYEKRDHVKEKQKEINRLFLDKTLRNSLSSKNKKLKEVEANNLLNAADKEKMKKYYEKEQKKRDQVIKYFIEI